MEASGKLSNDWNMLELELQQYLPREYPQENARCDRKEFKNLKNFVWPI